MLIGVPIYGGAADDYQVAASEPDVGPDTGSTFLLRKDA